MQAKNVITIEVIKDKTNLFLKLKVAKDLEEFFKESAKTSYGEADMIQASSKWFNEQGEGLKFYKLDEQAKEKINQSIRGDNARYRLYNDFGSGLTSGDHINLALLRTVGAAEGITIRTTELIAAEEIKIYIEELAKAVKLFYANYMKKLKLKAKISFEF